MPEYDDARRAPRRTPYRLGHALLPLLVLTACARLPLPGRQEPPPVQGNRADVMLRIENRSADQVSVWLDLGKGNFRLGDVPSDSGATITFRPGVLRDSAWVFHAFPAGLVCNFTARFTPADAPALTFRIPAEAEWPDYRSLPLEEQPVGSCSQVDVESKRADGGG